MTDVEVVVDVQYDFIDPNGRLPVPGADKIVSKMKTLSGYFSKEGTMRILTRDRHFPDDQELVSNGGPFPNHCISWEYPDYRTGNVRGIDFLSFLARDCMHTFPHKVAPGIVLPKIVYNKSEFEAFSDRRHPIIIENQACNVFSNPNTEDILRYMDVDRAFVYGVATDYCVLAAVMGMRKMGIDVILIKDCIAGIDPTTTANALQKMRDAGVHMWDSREITDL